MKKSLLIVTAASAAIFASCGGDSGTLTQSQLDSIAAKNLADSLETVRIADSLASARITDSLEQVRIADSTTRSIDSIAAIKAGKKYVPPKKTTPAPTPNKPEVKPEVTAPSKEEPKRTQEDINRDKKKAEFGDEAAKRRLEQDKSNQKKAEFGDAKAQQKVEEVNKSKKAAEFGH